MKTKAEVTSKIWPDLFKKRLGFLFVFLILSTIPARADISTGLQGEWQFAAGSGTNTVDSSGNGNTGTLSSAAPTWVAGASEVSSYALSFDGTNNYVSIPSSTSLNSVATNNQITISAWIKVASVNNQDQVIVSKNDWFLLINTNKQISMSTSNSFTEYDNGFSFTADNQWHLVTGTFDGTTIRLYKDGIFQTSYPGGALSSDATPVSIGANQLTGEWYFSGSIDDVRIYDRALSNSDIAQLYGRIPVLLVSENPNYVTPASVQLMATTFPAVGATVSDVEFCSNNNGVCTDIGDSNSSGPATTNFGTCQAVTNGNTYTLTCNNVPLGKYALTAVVTDSSSHQNASWPVNIWVTNNDLEGWWKFDDGSGTTASDSSGNGNTGTLSAEYSSSSYPLPAWVEGEILGLPNSTVSALSFNSNSNKGNRDYVSVPNSDFISTVAANDEITVSAWVNFPLTGNTGTGIVRMNNWYLEVTGNNQIAMSTSGASSETQYNGFPVPTDSQWHLITGTFDGTTIRMYEDGVLRTSYPGGALSSNISPLFIGSQNGGDGFFSGSIDDVRVYSRALSNSDIAQVYGKTPVLLTTDNPLNTTYTTAPAAVNLTATAYPASGVGVTHVEFYSNNNGTVTDLGAGHAGTVANTYTLTWNNVLMGIYTLTAVVTDSNNMTNPSLPVTIYVDTSQLSYIGNSSGLQSLTYNGREFVVYPSSRLIGSLMFQAPNGTQTTYGYSVTHSVSVQYNYYTGSNCSQILPANWSTVSSGSNPVCFQQVYTGDGPNQSDGYTLSELITIADPQTVKLDYYVTNNDTNDILEQFSTSDLMQFISPGVNQYIDYGIGSIDADNPTIFFSGNWGSISMFTDDYTKATEFFNLTHYAPTTNNMPYDWALENYSTSGGVGGNEKSDIILPGQTYHYALYTRFGSTTDTASSLVPQSISGKPVGYSAFAQAFPYLVNWPDRRPFCRMMWGGNPRTSTNPQGYWTSAGLNFSSPTAFGTSVMTLTNTIINRMNSMSPKPQGIIMWDMEGYEYDFTYVGYPGMLSQLSPNMNAVADQVFAAYKAAGYQVGMTIRPQSFMAGLRAALPATCTNGASAYPSLPGAGNLNDAYIATDAPSWYGGYECSATNTWSQPGEYLPNNQTWLDDDTSILNLLTNKVTYAYNRWGMRIFYIDSDGYGAGEPTLPDGLSSDNFSFNVLRQLQEAFPDCIFIPENWTTAYLYSATVPYNQAQPGNGGGYFSSTPASQLIWPQSFNIIDNASSATSTAFPTLVQSLQSGHSILFYDDIWYKEDTAVEGFYQQAFNPSGLSLSGLSPSNPLNMQSYGLSVCAGPSSTIGINPATGMTMTCPSQTGSGIVTGTISLTSAATHNQATNVQEINCPSGNCTEAYEVGTQVTLTAAPATGSVFAGWSGGGCSGTAVTCVVTINASQTVTATFNTGAAPVNYGDVNGDGNVTMADAELTAQYTIGLPVASFNAVAAEVSGTGKVDMYDAYLIAEYAIGKITKFPGQGGS